MNEPGASERITIMRAAKIATGLDIIYMDFVKVDNYYDKALLYFSTDIKGLDHEELARQIKRLIKLFIRIEVRMIDG